MGRSDPDLAAGERPAAERLLLYTRVGCHLCEEMRAVVHRVAGSAVSEVDVDGDAALAARYGEEVPVLLLDGAQVAFWRVEESWLRAALAG